MKLRIHRNSLRLRLNRSDVEQLRKTGICAEVLHFDAGSQLTYTLETSSHWGLMEAHYYHGCIRIRLPFDLAQQWADSDEISLSRHGTDDGGPSLLIEKDRECLHSEERADADACPNPPASAPNSESVS